MVLTGHPLTQMIMKYQTASYIRSLIDALMIENGEGSLQCACVDTHDDDLGWKECAFLVVMTIMLK